MKTYFASAERSTEEEIRRDIEFATVNPIMTALLKSMLGLMAVLNEHRQILAVNDAFLAAAGIHDPVGLLGLRPGEALKCTHAREMPGGCGTSPFCATCGAAVAIVAALATDKPHEQKCILTAGTNGASHELCLRVRSCVFTFEDRKLILLILHDITGAERWAMFQRTSIHDINNIVTALVGASEFLKDEGANATPGLAQEVHQLSVRLAQEMLMQTTFLRDSTAIPDVPFEEIRAETLFNEIRKVFVNHPSASGKAFSISKPAPGAIVKTNLLLTLRVLGNMVQNAFEATGETGEVKLWLHHEQKNICFCVWSKEPIPWDVAQRVFQRHFSTKQESGRGLGTYAMKLFGEQFLGGKVDFTTSETDGTIFRLCLPAVGLPGTSES